MRNFITWFIHNPVAANLLMAFCIGAGLLMLKHEIIIEFFPDLESDTIRVSTVINGYTAREIEDSVTVRIEEEIREFEGVGDVLSTSRENVSLVDVSVLSGADSSEMLDKIRYAVNGLSLPAEREQLLVEKLARKRAIADLSIYGDYSERELRQMAERIRDELIELMPGRLSVERSGFRNPELYAEIDQNKLIAYGLTLEEVGRAVRGLSINMSTGTLRGKRQELIVSSKSRIRDASALGDVVVKSSADGAEIRLADIAKRIVDGYSEDAYLVRYNQHPAMMLQLYRIGDSSVLQLVDNVRRYIADKATVWLPKGASIAIVDDNSKVVRSRIDLLLRNAWQGGLIVLTLLVLFLRPSIAFWVALGMTVSICGGLFVMGLLNISLNMISLFAFIMVLGMVVDDATVIAENVHAHNRRRRDSFTAALEGTVEVAIPVTFGMLTTVAAFSGLFMIAGRMGQLMQYIPAVVVPVLLFSFLESKFILPSHLRNVRVSSNELGMTNWQDKIANGLLRFVQEVYRPALRRVLEWRFLFLALAISFLLLSLASLPLGYLKFVFFPSIERDAISIRVEMAAGTPFEKTRAVANDILRHARQLQQHYSDPQSGRSAIVHTTAVVGSANGDSHRARIVIEVEPPEERVVDVRVRTLVNELRQRIGSPPGSESISFHAEIGLRGLPLVYNINSADANTSRQVIEHLQTFLNELDAVYDIESDLSKVKEELVLKPRPGMESSGLSLEQILRQLRYNFHGFEVERFQRGSDEVRVMLRLPKETRNRLQDLHDTQIRTVDGRWWSLRDLVYMQREYVPLSIEREDFKPKLSISANYDKVSGDIEAAKGHIDVFLGDLAKRIPGFSYQKSGEGREQEKTQKSIPLIFAFIMSAIYILVAIPLKSYVKPLLVMSVLPFAISGSLFGHILLGRSLTMPGVLGVLATLGVAVNASLLLVDFINRASANGQPLEEAIVEAGCNRFRAIFLTTFTTIGGLTPLMFEKSIQAQFLIPVAISMVFGILVSALFTLFLVPVLYYTASDVKRRLRGFLA